MSSSTNDVTKVRLTVSASNPAVEIFIIDGHFRQVGQGLGWLETELSPGLYKLKYRAGSLLEAQHLLVPAGSDPLQVTGPEMPFSTSAPLSQTRTTREPHRTNAPPHSHQVHETVGQDSWLYFFSRDLDEARRDNVATGLSLHRLDGDLLLDLAQAGVHDLREQWAACNVALDPGLYRLHLKLDEARTLEQTLVASPDWQTQLFLLRRDYGPDLRRVDLFNAAMLMARPDEGFNPDQPDWHLTELARQGLVNGRAVVSTTALNEMLYGKFQNPMLGLYGGHLLLLAEQPKWDLLQTVVRNSYHLLGQDHPDVQALALHLAAAGRDIPLPDRCETPPLLRASWRLLIEASATRPDLIPAGSLAARIADRVWGSGAWLVWEQPPAADPQEAATAPVEQSMSQMAGLLAEPQTFKTILEQGELTDVEEGLLRYAFQSARQPDLAAPPEAALPQAMGLPYASLQQTLAGLLAKVDHLAQSGVIEVNLQQAGDRGVVGSEAGGNIITGDDNQVVESDVHGDVVQGGKSGVSIGSVGGSVTGNISGRDLYVSGPQQQTTFDQRGQKVGTQTNVAGDMQQEEGRQAGDSSAEPATQGAEASPDPQFIWQKVVRQIETWPQAGPQDQTDLKRLVRGLATELEEIPNERQEEAEAIADLTLELIEAASQKKPNRVKVTIKKDFLKQAAKPWADSALLINEIVAKLVDKILAIVG